MNECIHTYNNRSWYTTNLFRMNAEGKRLVLPQKEPALFIRVDVENAKKKQLLWKKHPAGGIYARKSPRGEIVSHGGSVFVCE